MNITEDNRRIITLVMNALAKGDRRPFAGAMDEGFTWIMQGSRMAGVWRGRDSVQHDLIAPLFAQFADTYTNTPRRIHADGDFVIVECEGCVTTKAGKPYNNKYCFVIRMANGKMTELTEYLDTALADTVLEPLS